MPAWYEPDPIFAVFGNARTREEFAQHWVVKGHFHGQVPEDIQVSYETVAYLMAHAWYHWPMFDEALRKLLGMVEMAVKFRCKALGIDLTFPRVDKNGNETQEDKSLATLIDQLCKKEREKELNKWLHDIRWLRNYFAHPKEHSLMGGVAIPKIKNIVNLINLIFLDEAVCKAAKEKSAHCKNEYPDFKEGLFILECPKGPFLVTKMMILDAFQVKSDWVYICFFRPVLINAFKSLSNHTYAPPILALTAFELKDGVFEAKDFETGSRIRLYPTTHADDQEALRIFQQELGQLEQVDQSFFHTSLASVCGAKVRDIMYEIRWVG